MSRPTIDAARREGTGKGPNRRLRAEGKIPGVLYGNGNEPMALALDPRHVVAVLSGPYGRNSVVDLQVDGGSRMAIVKDYQVHPWKRKLMHVDFLEITESTPLTLSIPFRTRGDEVVQKRGARIDRHRDQLKVRCVAANIPTVIEYDMTTIEGEYAEISVSEVPMPEGVEPLFRKDFKLIRMKVAAAKDLAEDAEEGEASGDAEATEETSE